MTRRTPPSSLPRPAGLTRRHVLHGILAGAGALLVSGCSDGDDPASTTAPRSDPDDSSSSSRAATEAADRADAATIVVVVDRGNHALRGIDAAGSVTTLAGDGYGRADGSLTEARFAFPFGIAGDGERLVITDQGNDRICQLEAGRVTTLAGSEYGYQDGPAAAARFRQPYGLALAPDGAVLIADTANHRIRRIAPDGTVSTVAGGEAGAIDGDAATARFNEPSDVVVAEDGAILVADRANHRIRRIAPDGTVTTVAGSAPGNLDGPVDAATFNRPTSIALRPDGTLVVADILNHAVRTISPDGTVSTLAGAGTEGDLDGDPRVATFRFPAGVAVSPSGRVWVADRENHRIRRIEVDGAVQTIAGADEGDADGRGADARFSYPYDLVAVPAALLRA